jgi:hypothetical protein
MWWKAVSYLSDKTTLPRALPECNTNLKKVFAACQMPELVDYIANSPPNFNRTAPLRMRHPPGMKKARLVAGLCDEIFRRD